VKGCESCGEEFLLLPDTIGRHRRGAPWGIRICICVANTAWRLRSQESPPALSRATWRGLFGLRHDYGSGSWGAVVSMPPPTFAEDARAKASAKTGASQALSRGGIRLAKTAECCVGPNFRPQLSCTGPGFTPTLHLNVLYSLSADQGLVCQRFELGPRRFHRHPSSRTRAI
jgi:hypothetical protein